MRLAVFQGLSLCCIYYMFILKLIFKVFCFIIVLIKAGLSENIIRKSQRTLNRYSEFCGSGNRGFAKCSGSTDNEHKLDSSFGITFGYMSVLAFTALQHYAARHTWGNLLSPTTVREVKHPLPLTRKPEHIILPPHCFSSFSGQYLYWHLFVLNTCF